MHDLWCVSIQNVGWFHITLALSHSFSPPPVCLSVSVYLQTHSRRPLLWFYRQLGRLLILELHISEKEPSILKCKAIPQPPTTSFNSFRIWNNMLCFSSHISCFDFLLFLWLTLFDFLTVLSTFTNNLLRTLKSIYYVFLFGLCFMLLFGLLVYNLDYLSPSIYMWCLILCFYLFAYDYSLISKFSYFLNIDICIKVVYLPLRTGLGPPCRFLCVAFIIFHVGIFSCFLVARSVGSTLFGFHVFGDFLDGSLISISDSLQSGDMS